MVLLCDGLGIVYGISIRADRKLKAVGFIDFEENISNVVVEPAVEHKDSIDARRLTEQTPLGECIRFQFPLLHCTN